jgi:hypothetical protein
MHSQFFKLLLPLEKSGASGWLDTLDMGFQSAFRDWKPTLMVFTSRSTIRDGLVVAVKKNDG